LSEQIEVDPTILAYYDQGDERDRLTSSGETLEFVRTKELLARFLPPPPAAILDVGGAAGAYASWLADAGYDVHLVDPVASHVEEARRVAAAFPQRPFTAAVGDARRLNASDASFDVVLLLGPLYHLVQRTDRITALSEARRVLRRGGIAFAVGISRFASLLDGLRQGMLVDPEFARIVERDLRDGQHRNPDTRSDWFTTAFFHHPTELVTELQEAGFELRALLGIEGPGWLVRDRWSDAGQREAIVAAARAVEAEPALLGVSAHLLAVGVA
jgi:ubiquinone/menaquinone biosynthesis C-methylase UbiE